MDKSIHSVQYKTFLKVLRVARRRAGLTQIDVAKRIGETQSFVSKCERGERRIDVIELRAFCTAFGISLKTFERILKRRLLRGLICRAVTLGHQRVLILTQGVAEHENRDRSAHPGSAEPAEIRAHHDRGTCLRVLRPPRRPGEAARRRKRTAPSLSAAERRWGVLLRREGVAAADDSKTP